MSKPRFLLDRDVQQLFAKKCHIKISGHRTPTQTTNHRQDQGKHNPCTEQVSLTIHIPVTSARPQCLLSGELGSCDHGEFTRPHQRHFSWTRQDRARGPRTPGAAHSPRSAAGRPAYCCWPSSDRPPPSQVEGGEAATTLLPSQPEGRLAWRPAAERLPENHCCSGACLGDGAVVTTTVETALEEPEAVPCWRWDAGTVWMRTCVA